MSSVVLNGNAYSDDGSQSRDMRNGGYRNWLRTEQIKAVMETDPVNFSLSEFSWPSIYGE